MIKFLNLLNMQTRPFDVERSNYMNLMNCHAACIYLPREILISCESLSLRELTVHVFERNRFLSCGRENSKMFDFY